MSSLASIEGQFAAMVSNIGVWEGNLASYGPDGTVTTPKTPTILYVYCDTLDDAKKVAAGQMPYKVCGTRAPPAPSSRLRSLQVHTNF